MVIFLQNKFVKVIISIVLLVIGGILGDLWFIGVTYLLNGTAENSDKIYTLIYFVIFWVLFTALFKIKKHYDLKWVRRLFIPAPIILTLLILVGGAIVFTIRK